MCIPILYEYMNVHTLSGFLLGWANGSFFAPV